MIEDLKFYRSKRGVDTLLLTLLLLSLSTTLALAVLLYRVPATQGCCSTQPEVKAPTEVHCVEWHTYENLLQQSDTM